MKKSRKYLSILIAAPFAIVLIVMVWARIIFISSGYEYSISDYANYGDDEIRKEFALENFSELKVSGNWDLNIIAGANYSVVIEGPEYRVENCEVAATPGVLNLYEGFFGHKEGGDIEATITMPGLTRMVVRGGTRVYFSGFNGSKLDLEIDGDGRVTGSDGKFEELYLQTRGSTKIDLKDVIITTAEVRLMGETNMLLTMNGGALTGKATGDIEIDYYGTVSREEIRTTGVASIRQRE